jgi:hypothetical protein
MHFRERGHAFQVIRTQYDAQSKKGKNEIVGRIAKANLQISEQLQAALTAEEKKEVNAWLAGYATTQRLKREVAARALTEQMALAEEWFGEAKGDEARILAANLLPAWAHLRTTLKRHNLVD